MSYSSSFGTPYASDSGRSRPVLFQAFLCVLTAFLFTRGLGYLLGFTGWALGQPGALGAGASPWMRTLGTALAVGDPRVVVPALVVLSLVLGGLTTASWSGAERGTALMIVFIGGLSAAALTSNWSSHVALTPGSAPGFAVAPRADHDPFLAALYRPSALTVSQAGGMLRLSTTAEGRVAGRYRLRTQVLVAGTRVALAYRVREVELPRDEAALTDDYPWNTLVAGWRRGPRAAEPMWLHCDVSLTLLAPDDPADEPRANALSGEPIHRASTEYTPAAR